MANATLFVVFHHELKKNYYDESLLGQYAFINVNPKNEAAVQYSDYKIINQYEFRNFHSLGKWYTESEVMYNIFKNPYLCEGADYLGFLQHDIDSSGLNENVVSELTEKYDHINFQPYLFETDYAQRILMDENQPEKRNGDGLNCYDSIISDYNKFYGTNHTLSELSGKTINLCSSFILKKDVFFKMMKYIAAVIESGKLNIFDTAHQFRIQGGLLERYYAVWLALNDLSTTVVPLKHHFIESVRQDSIFNRILRKLGLK
ncbi:hypothetical protein SIO70_06555 [Chitinophaga sancti]|uniref:hypothetical protein n=1 Tax=Chitinophaga sancti TaxID=1004 RepID=UPI002A74F74F|nr:hypothetical protein [Chitinophaga sancti]WPQ64526.1 hypothetical protein SIO70_06555 [Chitinophaga sancti]